jgi:hypothetical protein
MSDTLGSLSSAELNSLRARLVVARRATLDSPQKMAEIHADTQVTFEVANWLAQLKMLIGVPFAYLVPDEAMLPPEWLRFFQVDQNWQYCLIEGAYSVARATTDDLAHDHATARHVHAAAGQLAAHRLARANEGPKKIEQVTGFLLRSGVVAGWPAMKVKCDDAAGNVLSDPPLRIERLTPDILLCLVAGVIARVTFQLPPESLHFGIDRDTATGSLSLTKDLRSIAESKPGTFLPGQAASISLRNNRVLKVNTTASAMRSTLKATEKFTPAEFAVEMIEGIQMVTFSNDSARAH